MKIMVSIDGNKMELAGNYGICFLSFYKTCIIMITAFTRQFNEGQHCILMEIKITVNCFISCVLCFKVIFRF